MKSNLAHSTKKVTKSRSTTAQPAGFIRQIPMMIRRWAGRSLWNRIAVSLIAVVLVAVAGMFSMSQYYMFKHRNEPLRLGATFIPKYATYLGVDPKETMDAMINDLGIRNFRLVSYWTEGEPTEGVYDFSTLDWQFQKAEAAGAKVSLAIGLRQPRWPECHMPKWAESKPREQWVPALQRYIAQVVDRYKTSPALESYQLENEYFLTVFGICPDFSRDRLIAEYNLVKEHDPNHPLIVSMSNNAIGTPINEPTPDQWAISVYKRVWDKTLTKRYFEYPIPAWYYGFRAGWTEATRGRNAFIHELQAEAWTPEGYNIRDAPISELYKSMNPERLKDRFDYGVGTGMKKIDLWGVEWWYSMKVNRGEPGLWEVAKTEYARHRQ